MPRVMLFGHLLHKHPQPDAEGWGADESLSQRDALIGATSAADQRI